MAAEKTVFPQTPLDELVSHYIFKEIDQNSKKNKNPSRPARQPSNNN